MTSVLRSIAARKEGLTRFIKPESPCFDDGNNTVLFPFSYENGVLDISYSGNNFRERMVDILNENPRAETDTAVRVSSSGPYLATSLGEHFKDYIRAWRDGSIDAGSPIRIHIAPQLMKVQEAAIESVSGNSGSSYIISNDMPASDTYPTGVEANKYETKFVFKTPLTFTIVEGGVVKYITFRTILDQE